MEIRMARVPPFEPADENRVGLLRQYLRLPNDLLGIISEYGSSHLYMLQFRNISIPVIKKNENTYKNGRREFIFHELTWMKLVVSEYKDLDSEFLIHFSSDIWSINNRYWEVTKLRGKLKLNPRVF